MLASAINGVGKSAANGAGSEFADSQSVEVTQNQPALLINVKAFSIWTTLHHALHQVDSSDQPFSVTCVSGTVIAALKKFGFCANDRIVGFMQLCDASEGTRDGGIPASVAVDPHFVVKLPDEVNPTDAVASLVPATKLLIALRQHVSAEATGLFCLLLCYNDLNLAAIALSLCEQFGLKVLLWCPTVQMKDALAALNDGYSDNILVVEFYQLERLSQFCDKRTCGNKIDFVLDLFNVATDDDISNKPVPIPTIINCLALNGKWITTRSGFELSSVHINQLHLKNASLSFLSELPWILCPTKVGYFLAILTEVVQKLKAKEYRPVVLRVLNVSPGESFLQKSSSDLHLGQTVYRY